MIDATNHNLPLRQAAGVSSEGMNKVYDLLRNTSIDHLKRIWKEADPWTPMGALLRHQIAFTIERLESGRWKPDEGQENS